MAFLDDDYKVQKVLELGLRGLIDFVSRSIFLYYSFKKASQNILSLPLSKKH